MKYNAGISDRAVKTMPQFLWVESKGNFPKSPRKGGMAGVLKFLTKALFSLGLVLRLIYLLQKYEYRIAIYLA